MDTIAEPAPTVTDLPIPNLRLLRKVLDHIDAHPHEWNQASWACETAMCVAGHAVNMTVGLTPSRFGGLEPADGTPGVYPAAVRELGLTLDEADDLFLNTLDGKGMRAGADCPDATVRERVQIVSERIAARAGEVL